ncbi:MAG: glycoside hydrolase [Betaproteobacteria bacterium]|nr:glycoside hydrolase [Betaproteobacteria bacterium]
MNINIQVLQTADSLTLTASQTFQTSKANISDIIKRCIFYNASSINTKAGQACALLLILLFLISMVLVPFETVHAATATSSSVKWHPGHYYTLMGDKNNPTYLEKVYDELKSTPALRGVQIRYTWAELETSYDVYNFSSIDKRLAELAAQNKRLVILLQTKSFDPKIVPVPDYLKTDAYEGGIFTFNNGKSAIIKGYNIKLWNSNVLSRMNKLLQELGKRYNSHPYFEGIGLPETAMGAPITPLSNTQVDGFYSNLLIANKKMREEFFPNTMTFQFTNYPRPILESFINNLSAMGTGLGGPDIFIEDPGLNHPGNKYTPSGVYSHYPKLSGIIPLTPSVMQANYKNTKWDGTGYKPTILELLAFARDKLKANYIFWTRDPEYFPQVLEMLNRKDQTSDPAGGLDPTCPSAYSSCVN